jgi:hypothetical protein
MLRTAPFSPASAAALMRPAARWQRTASACALLAAGLFGCSAYSPQGLQPGQSEADVVLQMGTPTGRYKLPNGGTRLEFARGPAGHETYMIDFDTAGRMVDWEQVMDLWYLTRIEPGMGVDDVLIRVGHPAVKTPIRRQQLVVWNYRYPTNNCLWFQISIGEDGKVISGNQAIDPQCDPGTDARGGGPGGGIGGVR